MPYIGKEPVAGNFVLLDSITTSATATYALTKDSVAYSPESARNMIVSLNGVTQAPEAAFTVSGSNITFSSALTSSDVIDYILVLGDVLSVGTPSDGTVGTSQMSYPLGNFSSTGIDDNATSTAITIDASENVGIGTTSPLNSFVVAEGTGQHGIELAPGTTSYIQAYDRAISDYGDLKIDAQIIQFGTDNGTERMRINSSGDVQIGTAAVTGGRYFDIYNTGSTATDFAITRFITQQVGSASTTSADIIKRKNGEFGIINNDTDSAAHINFKVGASERMRIDSSGKLLVGKTAQNLATEGISINPLGYIQVTEDQSPTLYLNRLTTNGDIVLFYKDGTTVGSIGVDASDNIYFAGGSGGTRGIYINDIAVYPADTGGSAVDNAVDLGSASVRWKDLYLSGGAYLGGTAAANKLDDYEEGTFTPQVFVGTTQQTLSRADGGYVKIGDYVFYQLAIIVNGAISGSGAVQIRNFPFSFGGFGPASNARASGSISYTNASIMPAGLLGGVSATIVDIYANATAGTAGSITTNVQGSDLPSGWNMHFTIQTRIA